jgi:hypothetical protein
MMRTQPLIYNFEYQRKGNTRKSIKGRFAQSDKAKVFWAKNRNNYSDKESPKASKNSILGLRDGVRLINKLNTITETIDSKNYVMPIYKYDFIKIESFMPRTSNRLKYKMKIPKSICSNTGAILYYKEYKTIFDSYQLAKNYAVRLEKQHVDYTKNKYEEYFKTNKYT